MWWVAWQAFWQVGLPVLLIAGFALSRLYASGELDAADDEDTRDAKLDALSNGKRQRKGRWVDLLEAQWMRFGGGFYGAAAVWTFVWVEGQDIWSLLQNLPSVAQLQAMGIVGLFVAFVKNQIENFVTAVTWFMYWGDPKDIWIWLLMAYGCYSVANTLAQRFAKAV